MSGAELLKFDEERGLPNLTLRIVGGQLIKDDYLFLRQKLQEILNSLPSDTHLLVDVELVSEQYALRISAASSQGLFEVRARENNVEDLMESAIGIINKQICSWRNKRFKVLPSALWKMRWLEDALERIGSAS